MANKPDTGGGPVEPQSVSEEVSLTDYLNTGSDSVLLGRVDFMRMITDFVQAIILTITLSWSAAVVGFRDAFILVLDAINYLRAGIVFAVVEIPGSMSADATEVAGGEIVDFGLFALPVSVAVGLSVFGTVAFVIYIFSGDELI